VANGEVADADAPVERWQIKRRILGQNSLS